MTPLTPQQFKRASEIADQLVALKAELGALSMFSTMHELDKATTRIGYEMAERSPRG